jgi:hypothetical protein
VKPGWFDDVSPIFLRFTKLFHLLGVYHTVFGIFRNGCNETTGFEAPKHARRMALKLRCHAARAVAAGEGWPSKKEGFDGIQQGKY